MELHLSERVDGLSPCDPALGVALIQRCHCWCVRADCLGLEVRSMLISQIIRGRGVIFGVRCVLIHCWWHSWGYRIDEVQPGGDHSSLCSHHHEKVETLLAFLPLGIPQLIHRYLQRLGMHHLENRRLLWGQSRHDFALNLGRFGSWQDKGCQTCQGRL